MNSISRKNFVKFIDPFMLSGILLSIILSLVLYITGLDTISSTIIGLLGTIVTLQIDQIARFQKSLHERTQRAELWKKVEQVPWLYPVLKESVEAISKISEEINDPFLSAAAKHSLEAGRNYLQELSRGYLTTPYDDVEPLMAAVARTKQHLRAISVFKMDETFWMTSTGERYFEANKRIIENGGKVERIFIYDVWSKELADLVKRQVKAGFSIHTVESSQVPANLRIDMIVFDSNFMYEAKLNAEGVPIGNIFSINQSEITQKVNLFNRISNYAAVLQQDVET